MVTDGAMVPIPCGICKSVMEVAAATGIRGDAKALHPNSCCRTVGNGSQKQLLAPRLLLIEYSTNMPLHPDLGGKTLGSELEEGETPVME